MAGCKTRWKRTLLWSVGIYLILPLIAGALGSKNVNGPKIYSSKLHSSLFRIGNQVGHMIFGIEIVSKYSDFYEKPWFYFMKRKRLSFAPPEWPLFDTRF